MSAAPDPPEHYLAGGKAPRWRQRRRILIVLVLTVALIVGPVIVGILAHSVSVRG